MLETEEFEGELKTLRKLFTMIKHIDLSEKLGNIYFICGESGKKDENNLPDNILICPAYGVDWFQVYSKTNQVVGPEY